MHPIETDLSGTEVREPMSEHGARLVSVNVGMPREVGWQGRTVVTGIWKEPVQGSRLVRRLNVDGDGQGDRAGHRGEQRAVFVYQLDLCRYWREQLQRDDFVFGQFGENCTVDGLGDDEVCIGDRYRIGSAFFEVTQPRTTCYRVGIRMNEPRMAALLAGHGRPGLLLPGHRGGCSSGRRRHRQGRGRGWGDDRDVHQRTAVPRASPRSGAASPGAGHARARPRLANIVPGHARAAAHRRSRRWERGLDVRGATAGVAGIRSLQVVGRRSETATVLSLELEADDGAPLTGALPGQFVTLKLEPGHGTPPLVRSYSLSGSPAGPRYRISVKVDPDGRPADSCAGRSRSATTSWSRRRAESSPSTTGRSPSR